MSTLPEVIHHNDLMHQMVLDRARMEELGRVEVVWMYAPAHKVLGFVCKAGFLGAKKFAFNLSQVHTYGAKSILVNSAPQETDAERVNQLESLVGSEVWSDGGHKLGKITDYRFDPQTGDISEYLFTTGNLSALTDGIYRLPPYRILSVGRQRVLIAESGVRSLSLFKEGLKQKLKKAEATLKQDYSSVTQEIRSLRQTAQDRARSFAEQAREKAQVLNEQFKEGSQTLAEKSQTLVEQVKEQAQMIRDQLAIADSMPPPAAESPDGESRSRSSGPSEPILDEWDDDWDIETPPATPTDLDPLAPSPVSSWPTSTRSPVPNADLWDESSTISDSETPASSSTETASQATRAAMNDAWEDGWEDDVWGLNETPAPAAAPASTIPSPAVSSSSSMPATADRPVQSEVTDPSVPQSDKSRREPEPDADEPWI